MKLAAGEPTAVSIGQWPLALAFAGYFALLTSGAFTAIRGSPHPPLEATAT